jgi:hypothetical protein
MAQTSRQDVTGNRSQDMGEGRGSGHRGPPKGVAFGVAAVTQALQGISFPISKQELLRLHGKEVIHWSKEESENLGDILKRVPKNEFQSIAELAQAVAEAQRSAQA